MANSPAKQLAISQINALCYFWPHLLVLFSLPNCLNPDLLDLGMGRMDVPPTGANVPLVPNNGP